MSGLFIVIEGPDGSGKTTQIKLISEYLKNKGYDIMLTREPGGTRIGEDIREIILDNENIEMSYVAEALLYAASRAQHVYEKIIPAIREDKVVICDRFIYSSLVYQGVGRELGIEKVKEINEFAIQGLNPDITLFFDISPEVALNRKTKYNRGDRLEKEDISFHKNVYNGYMKLIKMYPNDIKVIDATKNIEEVSNQIKVVLDSLLKK